jgi:N-acetylneuraminic acid mutarotase
LEVLDLSADKLEWQSAKQPFRRRALIAASYSQKMYVLGGFDEHGKVIQEVSIYDPATGIWTDGPTLPGKEIDGFSPAACVHDGSLYVSLADGELYRLDESKEQWEKSGDATPRVAHRIVSDRKAILVIGGADKGSNSDLIEAVVVGN